MNNIICGNSLEILPTIADNTYDYVFTSPPYNRRRNETSLLRLYTVVILIRKFIGQS